MKHILLTTVALSLMTTAAFAQGTKPVAKKVATAPVLKCAVTGEKIASAKESAGTSVYKGKTYYFCCAGCKPMFDKNPAKYAKTDKPAAKPAAKKVTKKAA